MHPNHVVIESSPVTAKWWAGNGTAARFHELVPFAEVVGVVCS
ncbi:MAG: hypothetical protein ABIU63_08065 [Chitinophagaceae bacterium]